MWWGVGAGERDFTGAASDEITRFPFVVRVGLTLVVLPWLPTLLAIAFVRGLLSTQTPAPAPSSGPPAASAAPAPSVQREHQAHAATQNAAAVYLVGLKPSSRRVQSTALATCARILSGGEIPNPLEYPWHRLELAHLRALRGELAARYAPETTRRHLAAVKAVLDAAHQLEQLDADRLLRLKRA